MKKSFLVLAFGFLFLYGCSSDNDVQLPKITNPNPIDLSDLQVGQKSYYRRYQMECESPSLFRYTGDTLTVEVVEEEGEKFLWEYFTPHSPLATETTEIIRYPIIEEAGQKIRIPERFNSALFFFYGNDTITLVPEQKVDLQQISCRLMLGNNNFIGNEFGQVDNFQVGSIQIQNKTAVSCVPIVFDLDAYLMYDQNQLYLSQSLTTLGIINGWVLLE